MGHAALAEMVRGRKGAGLALDRGQSLTPGQRLCPHLTHRCSLILVFSDPISKEVLSARGRMSFLLEMRGLFRGI